MAIKFLCPNCGKRLRAPASDAGRQIVCPNCAAPIAVPSPPIAASQETAPAASTAPSAPTDPFSTAKEIYVPGSSAGFATADELPPDPEIRARVFGPAAGLMAVGLCGLLLRFAGSIKHQFEVTLPGSAATAEWLIWPGGGTTTVFLTIMSALLILSGQRMRNLQSYWFAVGSSVLAMVPCVSPCCSLGLPIGIWSLAVLWNEEVKRAFRD
jgi:DNA-directed RNA polymerase subunit RPC12/RpoP